MLRPLLLLLVAVTAGQPPADTPVPMAEEPYHRLLFENRLAAVYDVVLPPGALMRYHRHPTNHLAVVIEGGTLRNEIVGAAAREAFTGAGGTVVYLPAGPPHRQSNVGAAPVHFVAAEILAPAPEGTVVDSAAPRPGCEVSMDNAVIVAWRCRVAPGGTLAALPAGVPFLRVALGAGAASWHDGSARADIRNTGGAALDLVEIAWRPPGKPIPRTAIVPETRGDPPDGSPPGGNRVDG